MILQKKFKLLFKYTLQLFYLKTLHYFPLIGELHTHVQCNFENIKFVKKLNFIPKNCAIHGFKFTRINGSKQSNYSPLFNVDRLRVMRKYRSL